MVENTQESGSGGALLVPVGESVTLRSTVAYAMSVATEDDLSVVHFVAPVAWHDVGDVEAAVRERTQNLLNRVSVWANEETSDDGPTVETALIGEDTYLFSPDDYAEVIATYASARRIKRIVVDPEYSPGGNVPLLRPMEVALAKRGFEVSEAPARRPVRRSGLSRAGSAIQFGLLFGISFLFYQLLGGFAIVTGDSFDLYYELITGGITAGIVAGTLYTVSLAGDIRLRTLGVRLLRFVLYVPYLVFEIVKSNILITTIILHPNLPIDPKMTRVRSAVWGGPAVTTLANSITLTPGTLTVRTEGQYLYVHGLFQGARDGISGGSLERAVRFVFYGRRAATIPTPAERGDFEKLQQSDADAEPEQDLR